ncbi:cytochrome o ubiquinol oxidase subunit IV [Pararoseomonas sp. SCSIO 73927]|uniref:cytochrome o ubiquinol oxidase subunit IV n=1 Tax=Pararoseomonas sp. SCSIO 73927 TaxID=3114537 RepID=UPI0030D52085
MSAEAVRADGHAAQGAHGEHGHGGHGQDEHGGAPHGSFKGYLTGFLLAAILTVIPFALVMGNVFSDTRITAFVVMALAVVQIVVHMVYFLHMNSRAEGGWTMLALIFTLVVVVITLAGSIWVMYHMNANMMPMPHDMRNMD